MKKIALIASCLGLAAVSLFLLLCRDDAKILISTDITRYAVQPEGNEESFNILLEALREERPYQELPSELSRKEKEDDGYQDLLRSNSEIIIHNYSIAEEVLRQLSQLDRFDGIGDSSSSYESEIVKFRSIRNLLQATCFYAELSYIDESKENDLNHLLMLHSIMSKWLPHTRTIVHSMIGVVALNNIRDTLFFIEPYLDPDEVQQVLRAYSGGPDYTRSIESALYSEYCMAADALEGIVSEGKGGLGYLLFKRNRTINIYGSYLEEQIAFSRDQDWGSMSKRSKSLEDDFESIHLTNWGGWTFLAMAVPAMNKVSEQAYEAKAKDLELIEKLHQDGAINDEAAASSR